MENLVLIQEVGAYSERQYQKQDGSTEYFKSRGVIMKHGGDIFYGEMTGDYASKNRETQYNQNQPYVVKGYWKQRTWEDQNHQTRHENMFYISNIQAL
jgi:hypothetical protein